MEEEGRVKRWGGGMGWRDGKWTGENLVCMEKECM